MNSAERIRAWIKLDPMNLKALKRAVRAQKWGSVAYLLNHPEAETAREWVIREMVDTP